MQPGFLLYLKMMIHMRLFFVFSKRINLFQSIFSFLHKFWKVTAQKVCGKVFLSPPVAGKATHLFSKYFGSS